MQWNDQRPNTFSFLWVEGVFFLISDTKSLDLVLGMIPMAVKLGKDRRLTFRYSKTPMHVLLRRKEPASTSVLSEMMASVCVLWSMLSSV